MIKIERARPDSFDIAWQLLVEYFETVQVIVRDSQASVRKSLDEPRSGIWIAFAGIEPAGCIALRPLSNNDGEVKRLYVRSAFRRQGIANQLLRALETEADLLKLKSLYLDTKDDLTEAIAFYQRAGYIPCERYNDNPQATMFLKKDLSS